MVDIKADTWTKSSFYYDEPSDTCDRSFLISSVSREFPFKRQKEETGSKSRNLNQEIFTFKSLFKREERKTKQKDS